MNKADILIELENIKRVLAWMIMDRQIRSVNAPVPEETEREWKKEYLWIIDYLPDSGK